MLRLPRAAFAIRLVLTLLFLIAWGEPAAMLHHCRVHDQGSHASAHAGSHATTHATTHESAEDVAHAGTAYDGGDSSNGVPLCSCVGMSCPASVAATTPAAPLGWRVVLVERDAAPLHRAVPAPRAATARLLPFANGPPAAA